MKRDDNCGTCALQNDNKKCKTNCERVITSKTNKWAAEICRNWRKEDKSAEAPKQQCQHDYQNKARKGNADNFCQNFVCSFVFCFQWFVNNIKSNKCKK